MTAEGGVLPSVTVTWTPLEPTEPRDFLLPKTRPSEIIGRIHATTSNVLRVWYNRSLHRILRMIFRGDREDVAHGDTRPIRRTLPRCRDGSCDLGEAAPTTLRGL